MREPGTRIEPTVELTIRLTRAELAAVAASVVAVTSADDLRTVNVAGDALRKVRVAARRSLDGAG